MKQVQFIEHYQTIWSQLQAWLDYLALPRRKRHTQTAPTGQFAELYRQTCHHLALAQARHYSPHLLERLNHLVVAGHQQFYREREPIGSRVWSFWLSNFLLKYVLNGVSYHSQPLCFTAVCCCLFS